MQNLLLKSLVLMGVIGGSCYVVWYAHESMQTASNQSDPSQFTALDTEDTPNQEVVADLTTEGDLSGGDFKFSLETGDSQAGIDSTSPGPSVESNEPQPTLAARPQEAKVDNNQPEDSSVFPNLGANKDVRSLARAAAEESSPGKAPELAATSADTNAPASVLPVMPQSYFSASGKDVPTVTMSLDGTNTLRDGVDSLSRPSLEEQTPSAPNLNADTNREIALASFAETPAQESNVLAPLPAQTEEDEPTVAENSQISTAPVLKFGPQVKPPGNGLTASDRSAQAAVASRETPSDNAEPGLVKIPANQPGPVLLPPSALPTLGMGNNVPAPKIPRGVITADAKEESQPEIVQTGGDADNPFAKFKSPPLNVSSSLSESANTDVLPAPVDNPFAKFQPGSVQTAELKAVEPTAAGFDILAPKMSTPTVADDPFARTTSAVLPDSNNDSPIASEEPVPVDLLPPADAPVLPAGDAFGASSVPPAVNNPAPTLSAVPPQRESEEDAVLPRMTEPQPLESQPLKPATINAFPPSRPLEMPTTDAPVLPEESPFAVDSTMGNSKLPQIQPAPPRGATFGTSAANDSSGNPFSRSVPRPGMPTISPALSEDRLLPSAESPPTPAPQPLFQQNLSGTGSLGGSSIPTPPMGAFPSAPQPANISGSAQTASTNEPVLPFGSAEELTPTPVAPKSLMPAGQLEAATLPQPAIAPVSGEVPMAGDSIASENVVPDAVVPMGRSNDVTIDRSIASDLQSPELKIEKIAPPVAALGEPLIYAIRIRNVGGSEARAVVVEDRIPSGTRLEGTIPQAVLTNEKLVWELGNIKSGDERTIKLKVTPLEPGDIGSVATVSFEAAVAATIRVTAPELSVQIDGPTEVLLGKNVPYKFTVRNSGQGDAKDVVLRAILPPSLKHPNGDDIEADLGNIPAGQSRSVDLVVVADQVGVSTPKVLIWMGGKNHAEALSDLRVLESRISVVRSGPKRRFVGRPADFVTQVTNDSSERLTNLTIIEHLPVSVDLAAFVKGWDPQRRVIERTLPVLEPGQTHEFTTQMIPNQAGEVIGKLIVQDRAGNRADVETPLSVKGFAELEADVRGNSKVVAVGEQVSFRLNLKNDGTASATNVQAAFEIPQGLTFSTATGPSTYQVIGNQVVFDPVGELPTNSEKTYDIVLTAGEACNTKVKVALLATDYEEPLRLEEPVRVISDAP